MSTILVVDDEKNIVSGLSLAFEDEGYTVITASNGKEAWDKLNSNLVDLVLTDLRMPEMSGDELIVKIVSAYPRLPVIVLSGHGTIETAVQTMRSGAVDFFTKPVDLDKLFLVVRKCLAASALEDENRRLQEEISKLKNERKYSKIIGKSGKVESLMATISQVAPTRSSVLILGESGTGKELVAEAIHHLSQREGKPFVKVHCAALSPTLLESELFGHEKGAFTGAVSQKKGRFELADGGTIFLDEIGEISPETQVKLLRVLQEKEFERVGGEKTLKVDVRVVAATNRNLKEEVKKGNFREDLYYRLAVVEVDVPPLRERKEDIELLASEFLKNISREEGKEMVGVSPAARKALYSYSWPGNIRELRNTIESAVVMSHNQTIDLEDLPPQIRTKDGVASSITFDLPITMDDAEKNLILETIAFCGGNKSKAAETLAIGRKTLHRKLAEWKIGEDVDEG